MSIGAGIGCDPMSPRLFLPVLAIAAALVTTAPASGRHHLHL